MGYLLLGFSINKESIIDVEGTVKKTDMIIESCSQKDVELHISQVNNVLGENVKTIC